MPGTRGKSGGRRPGAGRPPAKVTIRVGDRINGQTVTAISKQTIALADQTIITVERNQSHE